MQPFLLEKQASIADICRKHHVQRLFVFGSAARDDFDTKQSDVDLLLEFGDVPIETYSKNKRDLEEDFVRLFHRDVDLIVLKYVKNPFFLRQLDQDKELLYAA